jgi:hypothetical protein
MCSSEACFLYLSVGYELFEGKDMSNFSLYLSRYKHSIDTLYLSNEQVSQKVCTRLLSSSVENKKKSERAARSRSQLNAKMLIEGKKNNRKQQWALDGNSQSRRVSK